MVSGNRPGIRKRPWTQAAATGAEHKRPTRRILRSRPEPFGPRTPPYAAMRPSRVPAGVAHGSGMTLPDAYLEVQHPCWSCNSSSSSANAPADARRWEPVREPGNATSSCRHACAASRGRVEGGAPGADPTVDALQAHAHGGVVGERDARPAADGRRRPAVTRPFGRPRPQAFA